MTSKPLFSNLALWTFAVVLAFPLQVLILVVVQLRNDMEALIPLQGIGAYACTNYIHGSAPFRCNLGRLVTNAAEGAMMYNIFTVGQTFILAVLVVALLLVAIRILHLRLWLRPNASL
jgi:hypothetical protein